MKRGWRPTTWKVLVVLTMTAWHGTAEAQEDSRFEDLVPRWRVAMDSLHVPGMAVAVVSPDGITFVEGLGSRDIERGLSVTPDTRFYIASMTKPFVALAIILLAERGEIELNRPVRTYLPRFRLQDFTESNTITVRDLLAHRRGLQDYAITFGEAFSGQMTEERFYRLLEDVRAVGELDYSNLHYTILGRVIEAVTGDPWKEFLAREVIRPAGLTRTTTSARHLTTDPDAAVPYDWADGEYRPARLKTDRTMHAAGGMLSTAEDLARWVRIHLAQGSLDGEPIFPEAVIREMQLPQIYENDPSPFVPDHRRIGWGLGWDLREDRGMRLVHHGGSYAGWAGLMSFMPEVQTGVVVLTNTRTAGARLADIVSSDVYDRVRGLERRDILQTIASMLTPPPPPPAGPTLETECYVGRYVNEDWGTLEAWIEDGRLSARIGDLPLSLEWTGPDVFIADRDQEGRFATDGGGRVTAVFVAELAADAMVRFERSAEEGPVGC